MEVLLHAHGDLSRSAHHEGVRFDVLEPFMTPDQEFEQFFTANFDRLVRSVTAISGDPEVATDAVQDAFIKVHRHIQNFQGSSSFYTWL